MDDWNLACQVFTTENQPQAIREKQVHMCLAVPEAVFGQLQHHATLMGISESELATDLLKICDAVLDRDATEVPQWTVPQWTKAA